MASSKAGGVVLVTTACKHLEEIEVDYGHEILEHSKEGREIAITYDARNGARWRTKHRFESGMHNLYPCNPNFVLLFFLLVAGLWSGIRSGSFTSENNLKHFGFGSKPPTSLFFSFMMIFG